MSKLKISNKTGFGYDTKVSIDDVSLTNVTQLEIKPIKSNCFTSVKLVLDMAVFDIETENFTYELIYGGKDICTPNCKGCKSMTPSIQGCR